MLLSKYTEYTEEMRKEEEEMKMWMRKPKKALDIYRLAISTIFIFIPVLLVALYSIILIKLKKQAHPGEQTANAEEQRTRRNRNVRKMAIAIVLAYLHWTPTSLTSWYLFVCLRLLHIPVIQIYTLISALFLSPHFVWSTQSLASYLAAITAELLRDFWLSLELGKFNCLQETYNCECSGFLLQ